MGEKDLSQKNLEYYPDVFADCVNALLYEGERVLGEEALLRLLRELTGDERYEEILAETMEKEKEEGIAMCELLDKYWNGGVAEGKAESVGNIRSMHTHRLSAEAIAELIGQKPEYVRQVIVLCVTYPMDNDVSIAKRLLAGEPDTKP